MSETTRRVSCVVPTHGRDQMLAEAVRSVLNQTVVPFEIIVVDDLGSDATRRTVEALAGQSNVPLLYRAIESGTSGSAGLSRNRGAECVTGDLIAFLDDDDLWEPTFLESALARFDSENVVMAVAWTVFQRADYRGDGLQIAPALRPEDALGTNPGLTGSNFVILRDAFVRLGGFDPELWVANDKDFLIRFLDAKLTYTVVPLPLVLQRAHDEGQLTSRTERRAQGLERFMRKYSDRLDRRDRRRIRHAIYSIRRTTSAHRSGRALYLVLQALTYSGNGLFVAIGERLRGKPVLYR